MSFCSTGIKYNMEELTLDEKDLDRRDSELYKTSVLLQGGTML